MCCNYTFTNILSFFAIFSHFFVHCLYVVLGSPTHHIHNVNGGSHSNCISPQLSSPRRMISRCQMVLLPIYRNNCIRRYCNASPLLSSTVLKKMWEISKFMLQGKSTDFDVRQNPKINEIEFKIFDICYFHKF